MCQSVRVTAVLGNGFPPGGTKAEATHRSAPDFPHLQHYLHACVVCAYSQIFAQI